MRSLRWSFATGLLCASAAWSACGGVADPGPLPGRDGDTGNTFGLGGLDSDGTIDDAESQGGRGGASGRGGRGGAGGREGNPPLGVAGSGIGSGIGGGVGNGGRANASGGSNGSGGNAPVGMGGAGGSSSAPNGGTGGAALGGSGAEPETGGSGGIDGSGGTEPETGGSGGEDTETGGSGGDAEGGSAGAEPETGGSGGQAGDDGETGGSGGEVAQGGAAGSDVPSEPPPIIDVEVGQCEGFEPCGGDVEGVWTYTAACVDLADLGLAEDEIQGMCPGADLTLSGQVSGTLTFEDGFVTRQGQSVARGEVFVPAACALVLGGCGGVEDELAATGLAGANCIAQGLFFPTCRCSFVMSAPALDEVAFITDGDVLRLADGRDFQYCASGDNLSYVEIGTVTEPGVRELTRR